MKPLSGEAETGSGIDRARRRCRIGASPFQLSAVSAACFLRKAFLRRKVATGAEEAPNTWGLKVACCNVQNRFAAEVGLGS